MNTILQRNNNKKLKISVIVLAAVLAVFVALSVFFGLKLPKTYRDVRSDDDNYTQEVVFSEDEMLYSTTRNLILTDKNGKEKTSVNVEQAMSEKFGVNIGQIVGLYKEKGSDTIWVATLNADERTRYIVSLSSDLTVNAYSEYTGEYDYMKQTEGYLFLFSRNANYHIVTRYEANNLSDGKTIKGNLFETFDDGNRTELSIAKGYKVYSVDYVVDGLYILTNHGIVKTTLDLDGCRYLEEYEEEIAALKETNPDADETELIAEAENKIISRYGLVSFDASTADVVMNSADYDADEYLYVAAEVGAYSGGAYVVQNNKFYIISSEGFAYSVSPDEINATGTGEELECGRLTEISLKGLPVTEGKAFFFDAYGSAAYVIYNTLPDITKIDLINETVEYSVSADFNVSWIAAVGDNLSYMYYNSNYAASGVMIRALINVDGHLNASLYKTLFIVSVVLSVLVAVAFSLITACCLNDAFASKALKLFKSIAKSKFIYLAMLPSFILLCLFCFYPAIASIGLSLFDYTQAKPMLLWNNFKHYINIFTSEFAAEAFSNMAIFLFSDLLFALVPPLIFAFFLTVMSNRKYSAITRTLLFIPGIIPSVTGLLIWKEGIYGFNGVLNMIIKACGGQPLTLLSNASTAKWAIIMMGFPFVGSYLIFYGAMMNIPDSYYEAAELEGCGIVKRFFKIDMPLIMSQIKYVIVCTFIASLQNFARTYMIDKSASYGTKTPIHIMYSLMLNGDYGYSAAYATVIFVLLLFATIINMKMQFKGAESDV